MRGRHAITTRTALALLLTAVALLAVAGCTASEDPGAATAARSAEATTFGAAKTSAVSSEAASATAAAAAAAASTGQSGSSTSSGLSAKEAAALDAELSAIQSELDKLSVPGDSDFESIGSGLK